MRKEAGVKTSASLDFDHLLLVNHNGSVEFKVLLPWCFRRHNNRLNGLFVDGCSAMDAVAEVSTPPEIAGGTGCFGQTDALFRDTARTDGVSSIRNGRRCAHGQCLLLGFCVQCVVRMNYTS